MTNLPTLDLILLISTIPILIALSAVDFLTKRIPNFCSFFLGALGVCFASLNETLIINLSTSLALWLLLWTASEWYFRAHELEALGLGDVKLMTALAIWLGPQNFSIMLFLASTSGIIVVLVYRLKPANSQPKKILVGNSKIAVPFGPLLAYSFFLTILISIP